VPKYDFTISMVTKADAAPLLARYHYLTGISRGFKSGFNVGLYWRDDLVGVCIFTGFPVPELVVGAFGLDRHDQAGFWELSRLVLRPDVQASEHNLAGWFIAKATQRLQRIHKPVRAILSYADADHHTGTVYRATGFVRYGMTDPKADFWIMQPDGTHIKHSRGPTKGVAGEWRKRSQKHRYMKIFDPSLMAHWRQE
jgi:hypothetical protein